MTNDEQRTAMYCNQCPWLGRGLADGMGHSQANPGHVTTTLDVDHAEAEANRLLEHAAELVSQANELRRRAGLLVDADR